MSQNSEVYNNFVTILAKNKQLEEKQEKIASMIAIPLFEEMEDYINSNQKLYKIFSLLQTKFATDFSYRKKFDNEFVESVMLLHLNNEENK